MHVRAGGPARSRHVPVDGDQVAGGVLGIVAVLLTAGVVVAAVKQVAAPPAWLIALADVLDLAGEGDLPTWCASVLLLSCAGLLHLLARQARAEGDAQAWGWSGLGWLFVALSVDETAQLHERLAGAVAGLLALPGPSSVAWTFLGCGFALGALLVFRDFLASLPLDLRRRLLAAGALCVGAPLALDAPTAGPARVALEEGLELLGLVVLLHALLRHVGARAPELTLRFARPTPAARARAPEPETVRVLRPPLAA